MKLFTPIILGLALFASASGAAEADSLVTVIVQGTKIDHPPVFVNILAAKPDEEATKLIQKGGKPKPEIPTLVSYRGVEFSFASPKEWRMEGAHSFADGDVIYQYHAESKPERDAFVERYGLKPWDKLVEKHGASSVFLASPGYYVMVLIPETVYACGMHPQTRATEAGRCPVCGMDLVRTRIFK